MRHTPCGHCPPDLRPLLFFLFWRKKRTAAPGEEKKENFRNRNCIPCRHHVTAHSPGLFARPKSPYEVVLRAAHYLDDGGHLTFYEYATSCRGRCPHRPLTPPQRMPSLGGRWPEGPDEGMEHSSKCNVVRNCSPALIRLASLGTFPGG